MFTTHKCSLRYPIHRLNSCSPHFSSYMHLYAFIYMMPCSITSFMHNSIPLSLFIPTYEMYYLHAYCNNFTYPFRILNSFSQHVYMFGYILILSTFYFPLYLYAYYFIIFHCICICHFILGKPIAIISFSNMSSCLDIVGSLLEPYECMKFLKAISIASLVSENFP